MAACASAIHGRTPIAAANKRSSSSRESVAGPAAEAMAFLLYAVAYRLSRNIFGVDRLRRAVTVPLDGQAGESA